MKNKRNCRPGFFADIVIDSIFAYIEVARKAEDWQLAASWQPAAGAWPLRPGRKVGGVKDFVFLEKSRQQAGRILHL